MHWHTRDLLPVTTCFKMLLLDSFMCDRGATVKSYFEFELPVQLARCPPSLFSQINLLTLQARFCASVSLMHKFVRVTLVYLAAKFCALTPMLRIHEEKLY